MSTNEFESLVKEHSLPDQSGLYAAVAFAAEAGEVCNNIKKMHMARARPDWVIREINPLKSADWFKPAVIEELGDALFYLTRIVLENGYTLEEIMLRQEIKLFNQCDIYECTFLK